jgi:hypothetical protein
MTSPNRCHICAEHCRQQEDAATPTSAPGLLVPAARTPQSPHELRRPSWIEAAVTSRR